MTSPSVNRAVHYVSAGSADGKYPSVCRAATVTEVDPGNEAHVGLMVVNPTGIHFRPLTDGGAFLDESDAPAPQTWHWPERV